MSTERSGLEVEKANFLQCQWPNCNWSFKSKFKLKRHTLVHTKEKPHKCDICNKAFGNLYNLNVHKITHKKSPSLFDNKTARQNPLKYPLNIRCKQVFKCVKERCNETFYNKDDLVTHLEKHCSKHICSECGKIFSKPYLLKKHYSMHSKELDFKCDHDGCNKLFFNQTRLNRHKATHSDKKLFICDVKSCNKEFAHSDYLRLHQRSHLEKKQYMCPDFNCKKMFVCMNTLKTHMQLHTGIRPHQCHEFNCGKTYLTRANLKAHQKTHFLKSNTHTATPQKASQFTDFLNLNTLMNNSNLLLEEDFTTSTFKELINGQFKNNEDSVESNLLLNLNTSSVFNSATPSITSRKTSSFKYPCTSNQQCNEFVFNKCSLLDGVNPESFLFNLEKGLDNQFDINSILHQSMELSTGHLVVDGSNSEFSLCMPDHVYSHQTTEKSTVNLEDIRP